MTVTPVTVTGIGSKLAVTVTALAGMVNDVLALVALVKVTPALAVVQSLNCIPAGAVPALIFTVVPCA